jgi:hypothetical protein
MTIKEAILKSLEDIKDLVTYKDVTNHIIKQNYYEFTNAKTPDATISSQLGSFIKDNDNRVKRVKNSQNAYLYYLSKYEENILKKSKETYKEKDLHKLLSTYLKYKNIYSKTILHEKSKNGVDNYQKWIHPDMIGIEFLDLTSEVNKAFMTTLNKADTFKINSYEIKREINTDYVLKKSYFQAVSNSSWANYGYLVALEINNELKDEMQRLNESFGIGIIHLGHASQSS